MPFSIKISCHSVYMSTMAAMLFDALRLSERFGEDDAAVDVAAFGGFVFAGDHQ